ncbi:hypothetical protein [Nocardia carnea]|uniref:hypothetical protein n=1 Tax=Nocardia carnea TaxID=37328 RepID=UPI002456923A|nr:hypothetical protein [Nocardia carnea]
MTEKPAEPDSGEPADDALSSAADSASGAAQSAAGETSPGDVMSANGTVAADPTVETSAPPAPGAGDHAAGSTGAEAGKPVGPHLRPRVLLSALAVAVLLLIGAVGAAGYLFVQERDKAEILAAHDEARQAACRYAPVLANYDAQNLDPYFSAVLAGATGDWKKEFETTTAELREALVAGHVVSTAGDIQCAVKSAGAGSAEVVVVIGQTITSLGTRGQPAPGQLAMVMRMQKTDGRWLVDQMTSPLATPLP